MSSVSAFVARTNSAGLSPAHEPTEVPFLFGTSPPSESGRHLPPIGMGRRQSASSEAASFADHSDYDSMYDNLSSEDNASSEHLDSMLQAPGARPLAHGNFAWSTDFASDPLFDACARGDMRALDLYLQQHSLPVGPSLFAQLPPPQAPLPGDTAASQSLFSTPFSMDSIFARHPAASPSPMVSPLVDRRDAYGRTPLMAALLNSHTAMVTYLLERGADPNARDKAGMSALQYAVVSQNAITTRALLEAGAKPDYQSPTDGFTALMMAAISGNEGVVQVLLDAGADVNICNWKYETALMYMANLGSEVAFRMLLAHGADVRAVSVDDCTALTYAAARGKSSFCEALAAAGQAQFNLVLPHVPNSLSFAAPLEKPGTSTPALLVAASHGHLNVVVALVGWGVGPNLCRNPAGATALMTAAEHGRRAVVEYLVDKAGADVNLQDVHGDTALIYACRATREDVVRTLLHRRAAIDVDTQRSGTPLLIASSLGAVGIVASLLSQGAAIDKPSIFRPVTPLLAAAMNGREEVIRLLVHEAKRRFPDISAMLNARDENGWTALMYLAGRGLHVSVRLLLTHGANPNIAGVSNGATALMLAATGGRMNVIEQLLQYGANPHARTTNGKTAADLARMQRLDRVARLIEGFVRSQPDPSLLGTRSPSADLSAVPPPSFLPGPGLVTPVPPMPVNVAQPGQQQQVQAQQQQQQQQRNGQQPAGKKKAAGGAQAGTTLAQDRRITTIGKITYNKSVRLGSGSHGTLVYEGFYDGVPAAIKRIPKMESCSIIDAEIKLLMSMLDADETGKAGSEHVVRYYGKEENEDFVFLAMERMHLTLQKLVHQCRSQLSQLRHYYRCPGIAAMDDAKLQQFAGPLYETVIWQPRAPARDLLRSVLLGVQFLHSNSIVHNDLKPGNILLTADYKVKIADMGLALELTDGQQSFTFRGLESGVVPSGLGGYFAPEVLTGERKTIKVDVFAVGCLAYYILTGGFHPFETGGKLKREANIMDGLHDLSRLVATPLAHDLVQSMIARQPEQRPTVDEVLAHPFFWSAQDALDAFSSILWLPAERADVVRRAIADNLEATADWVPPLNALVPSLDVPALLGQLSLPPSAGTDPFGLLRFVTTLADKIKSLDPAINEAFASAAADVRNTEGTTWAPFWELDTFQACLVTVLFEAFPSLPLVVHRAERCASSPVQSPPALAGVDA